MQAQPLPGMCASTLDVWVSVEHIVRPSEAGRANDGSSQLDTPSIGISPPTLRSATSIAYFIIPDDVMLRIFRFCLPPPRAGRLRAGHDESPRWKCFAFSQISRHWRSLAINDPSLWSELPISRPEMLDLMIARSRTHPLSIVSSALTDISVRTARRALDLGDRLVSLDIKIDLTCLAELLPSLGLHMHHLRRFGLRVVGFHEAVAIDQFILPTASMLTELSLINSRMAWSAPHLAQNFSLLSRITVLEIDQLRSQNELCFSFKEVALVLQWMRSMIRLSLGFVIDARTTNFYNHEDYIYMPHLVELILHDELITLKGLVEAFRLRDCHYLHNLRLASNGDSPRAQSQFACHDIELLGRLGHALNVRYLQPLVMRKHDFFDCLHVRRVHGDVLVKISSKKWANTLYWMPRGLQGRDVPEAAMLVEALYPLFENNPMTAFTSLVCAVGIQFHQCWFMSLSNLRSVEISEGASPYFVYAWCMYGRKEGRPREDPYPVLERIVFRDCDFIHPRTLELDHPIEIAEDIWDDDEDMRDNNEPEDNILEAAPDPRPEMQAIEEQVRQRYEGGFPLSSLRFENCHFLDMENGGGTSVEADEDAIVICL